MSELNLQLFPSAPLSVSEVAAVRSAVGNSRYRQGMCFWNAWRLVTDDQTGLLTYAEGVLYPMLPKRPDVFVHHAWVVIAGKVIDPTSRLDAGELQELPRAARPVWRDRVAGIIPSTCEYRGRTFDSREVARVFLACKSFGGVLDDAQLYRTL